MLKVIDDLINTLNYLGLEVFNCKKIEDNYLLNVKDLLITYNIEEKYLYISFHVSVKPDTAAGYTLYLKNEIQDIKDIHITESFYFDKDKNIVSGDEAYELFENDKNILIFNGFIKDRIEKELLISTTGYSC